MEGNYSLDEGEIDQGRILGSYAVFNLKGGFFMPVYFLSVRIKE
jgi:hypothetical protein